MYKDKNASMPRLASESLLGKHLPANVDAERSVLGAVLLNDAQFGPLSELLQATDFYMPQHTIIFDAMLEVVRQSKRIDMVTLQDELTKKNQLDAAGGIVYLVALQEDIPSVGMVEHHATLIKEKAVLRELIGSATTIITECYKQDEGGIDAMLDHAEKTIFQIANKRTAQQFVQLDIWLKKTFQHLSEIKAHRTGITGVPTGYRKLNEMTSGFQAGDFVVLAARPAMGKTSLALNIMLHAAQDGYKVGMFSLEMPAEQLALRLLSTESGISFHRIRNASMSSDEWLVLTQVAGQLTQLPICIDDSPAQTSMDVRAKARKLRAEGKLDFLVIDYLQLLYASRRHENRHQEVSEISRSLKALAKELSIPILALSQLSREVDKRMDKRPLLSDLRESGAIEQDADLIMFLYRDAIYNPDIHDPIELAKSELIVGKQRNGPTGTIYLNFVSELTKFEDTQY